MVDQRILVSVIVPCRNEASEIGEFLDNVLGQKGLGDAYEVLIADGLSDDGTRGLLLARADQDARLRIFDNPRQTVSPGLNEAIRRARADVIIRMDVHTRYSLDYLSCCLEVLAETGAQNVGGAARTEANGLLPRTIAEAYASVFAVGGARFHFPDFEGPVDTVPYGCWYRKDLIRWGMFDEVLDRNQDDELNHRIRLDGGVIWQSRRIQSWYRPRPSLIALYRQYYQYGRWKPVVICKHKGLASWRHAVPPLAVAMLALAATLTLVCPPCRPASLVAIGGYVMFLLFGSLVIASRGRWKMLPLLPAVLASFHFGYGSGFLVGVFNGCRPPGTRATLTR